MVKKIINQSIQDHKKTLHDLQIIKIEEAGDIILNAVKSSKTIFWCGNGGSASQASHLSAEMIGGMYKNKIQPFKSICLNSDTSFITAWSNDDSFDNIFSRQLEALSSPGDLLITLSTSGNSTNLLNAAEYAKQNNLTVISLTGNDGGELKKKSDFNLNIFSSNTQTIQEMHILIGHILCAIVEQHEKY